MLVAVVVAAREGKLDVNLGWHSDSDIMTFRDQKWTYQATREACYGYTHQDESRDRRNDLSQILSPVEYEEQLNRLCSFTDRSTEHRD